MQSTSKKSKKGSKKVKKMKFISSAKKNHKKRKQSQGDKQEDTGRKSHKKRKVVFHISKPVPSEMLEQAQETQEEADPKQYQIKKVDFIEPENLKEDEESEEIINMEDEISPTKHKMGEGMKKLDKLEMIGSDKLSELLSSKKKHRYKPVQDSMDGVIDENVGQHINFTEEEANLKLHEYSSDDHSDNSYSEEELEHDIDHLEEDRQSCIKIGDNNEKEEPQNYESIGSIQRDTHLQNESYDEMQYESYHNRNSSHIDRNLIIESMTYQQEQFEKNDMLAESEDENQTVINCTQSDMNSSEDHLQSEEHVSDKNAVVDEFSLEYDQQNMISGSSEEIADTIENEDQHRVFSYREDDSEFNEGEEEILSRVEYPLDTLPQDTYTGSEAEEIIKEIDEEHLYRKRVDVNTKKQFENTLTNMRIAFGSELQVRENSVKTLEKMAESTEQSQSAKKNDSSSIFEKKSFQDFSLKKFTELMQVKNMKNFQNSMQKTFREYNRSKILSMSDKKEENNKTSSTPKKTKCISPRKFSMRDLELDRIGYEKMKENSEKKDRFINEIIGSCSSRQKNRTSCLYRSNLSVDKSRKEISSSQFSDDHEKSSRNIDYKTLSPCKNTNNVRKEQNLEEIKLMDCLKQPEFDSPEPTKSMRSKKSS